MLTKKIIHKIKSYIPQAWQNNNSFSRKIKIPQKVQIIGCKLSKQTELSEGVKLFKVVTEGTAKIGKYTTLWGPDIELHAGDSMIQIGNFCSIAKNVTIYNFNHKIDRPSTYFFNKNIFNLAQENDIITKGDILIGNDVWIGANAVILSGITIGDGAVIAAGSIVNKDIPPYAIVGGVPAKILKYRFSEEIIKQMEIIQWWNWPVSQIKKNYNFFNTPVSRETIKRIQQ